MNDMARMTSHRPYLLRALYEWIVDNGMTPHLLVDALGPGVRVPPHTVKDGRVVLNVADRAVARLHMDNEAVSFTARFGGVSHPVTVPVGAVLAIYARETGQGMALPDDQMAAGGGEAGDDPEGGDDADRTPGGDVVLGVVPGGVDDATPRAERENSDDGDGDDDGDGAPTPRRGAHLRVIK
ncbi:ClpXP protease specificity-enhancing factor [Luteimonas sp. MJ174]|uniref:ClpXP protease specificity-enhancing factor n=1 Tax=Luteimonas sp. MJ174 TaxID=3129237 RepID=UPI0031BB0575